MPPGLPWGQLDAEAGQHTGAQQDRAVLAVWLCGRAQLPSVKVFAPFLWLHLSGLIM